MLPLLLPVDMAVSFSPDLRVFGFATAISVVAGVLFGVVPALRASRPDIVDTMKDGLAGNAAAGCATVS
jgi:ABC-type antimicrobial peptide transport system permease subunit